MINQPNQTGVVRPAEILASARSDQALRQLGEKLHAQTETSGTPYAKIRIGYVTAIDAATWTCTAYFSDLTTPISGIPMLGEVDPSINVQGVFTQVGNEYTLIGLLSRGGSRQFAFSTATSIATPLSGAFGNVTGFSFFALIDHTYAIDCTMFLENPSSSAPDWRSGWTWTGSGEMTSGQTGVDVNTVAPAYNGPNTAHAIIKDTASPLQEGTGLGTPAAVPVIARVAATFVCTGTGVVQMQHAQAASDPTFATNVKHGSRMIVQRLD